MKVGDIIQIKSPAFYAVGAYHTHLFDEKMLVTDIIDELALPDSDEIGVTIPRVVECISESGVHRFPMEDMEVLIKQNELTDQQLEEVQGGMSAERFDVWRVEKINEV
jgi:hypothetical protein